MGSPPQSSATRDANRNGRDAGQPSLETVVTAEVDLELLSRFEPVLRLTAGELFRPGRVEDYLAHASLVVHRGREVEVVAEPGSLTPDSLARLGARSPGEEVSLRFVDHPMKASELREWRRAHSSVGFRHAGAAAASGLGARAVAAVMRLSLLVRGRVPGGQAAVAYDQARVSARTTAHYYGHVHRDAGFTALQYWFFYPMNDWRSSFRGVNDHEADWEQVTVFVVEGPDGLEPAWVAFASHDEKGADLRRRWDDPDLRTVGTHPVAYVGAGSHSAACLPGDYLVRVAPDLPGWLTRLRSWIGRILPWWDAASAGIGIPFIDYRRGDGVAIGPDQDLEWTREVIDDSTPWVRDYRGLWGLDTRDPLGGERAPAGPRYERDGTVRQCWRAPVAWAALDEVLPTLAAEQRAWHTRPERLAQQLEVARSELADKRVLLRDDALAERAVIGGRGTTTPSRRRLRAEVTTCEKEVAQLEANLEEAIESPTPPPPPDPHAHLSARAVPLHLDPNERSTAVRVWSSASAAILFTGLGLLLLLGTSSIVVPVLGVVLAMLLVEAAVRRHLLGFVVNLLVAAAVVTGAWWLVRLLLDNLRAGIGVLLLAAAVVMAVQGLSDAVTRRPSRQHRREGERS